MLLTKANTIIMLAGSRLQPGDTLDASQPTCVRHQLHVGGKGEPDEQMNLRPRALNKVSADLL